MGQKLIGRTLNQYELVSVIGQGELATVYKAYQTGLERWVAVKVLHTTDRVVLARFKREAVAVAQLRHRNILMVHQFDEQDGIPYIAMEYVAGGTLEDYLQQQSMDLQRMLELVIPVGDALHYAHCHGLIHRDVKPSNILMAQDDWPLLADFGLVKIVEPVGEPLTDSGEVMGTPGYIPPEQAASKEATPRSDMYSVGVIMFELVTGRLPFLHRSPQATMLAHISDEPPLPSALTPHCPPDLEQIILRAMQKSPDDRFADMAVMVATLREFAAKHGLSASGIGLGTRRLAVDSEAVETTVPDVPRSVWAEGSQSTYQVRFYLPNQDITIFLPDFNPEYGDLIVGRAHEDTRIEIDLSPYDALDAGVSRRHARLLKQRDEWWLEDLGSMNGTFLNDTRLKVDQPVPLRHNDIVRFGLLSLVFLTAS